MDSVPRAAASLRTRATSLFRQLARNRKVASFVALVGVIGTLSLQWAVPKALDALLPRFRDSVDVTVTRFDSLPPDFVIPRPIHDIPPAPDVAEQQRSPWAYGLGGVDAERTEVQVVVEGRGDTPVILQDIRIDVLERREPMPGTLIRQGLGDLVDVRYITIDLDAIPPALTLGSGYIEGEGEWSFPLRVSGSEPEVLHLFASTKSCDCSWVAELFYVSGGERGSVRVDNNGQPFRTTSAQNAAGYAVSPDGTEFIPLEDP